MVRFLGIDVGGTFTDFVEVDGDAIRTWKRLSTPAAPDEAVLAGVPGDGAFERVVHGSTVATNALLERKGPRTFLVVTEGFKDLLEIRRQVRSELYALEPRRSPHVVARGNAIEVRERLDHEGNPVVELPGDEVARVVAAAKASGGDVFAVCLLHSYANPEHEKRVAGALRDAGLNVCASHEVLPQYREYERASTTAINAFLQPTVQGYVARLEAALDGLRVMHSGAGLATPAEAGEHPVTMIVSGPAGGVLGAAAAAEQAGIERIISFDMGGTSTDVALSDGGVRLRNSTEVDGMAVQTPLVDIVTVGAGGGSIARIDEGGALQVGPASAGADPGPACYGKGTEPTVTDANLVLGRLWAGQKFGASLEPDVKRAEAALRSLGGEAVEMAQAVVDVANANMARALRRVSLERGHDPADFALVAFGGAGPLHACELAGELGIPRVLIPRTPGVLSALGMVTAPEATEMSRALLLAADASNEPEMRRAANELEQAARNAFSASGSAVERVTWAVDARYAGQAHELRVEVRDVSVEEIAEAFHASHEQHYGFATPARTVELVNLRVRVEGPRPGMPAGEPTPNSPAKPVDKTPSGPVYRRHELGKGQEISGPAVFVQDDATTYLPTGWRARTDAAGNLVAEVAE